MQHVNWTALIIFVALFAFITWLGFAAAQRAPAAGAAKVIAPP